MTIKTPFWKAEERISQASANQSALPRNDNAKELRWLAEVILSDVRQIESCIADAVRTAERGSYAAPDWQQPWLRRCLARITVEKVGLDIQEIASNYVYQFDGNMILLPLSEVERTTLQTIPAAEICARCNALERTALILHGYLSFSDQDCALLLNCRRSVVEAAYAKARSIITTINMAFASGLATDQCLITEAEA
jgi:hypothetical protein